MVDSRFGDNLDMGQSMALIQEAQSAQNLLRDTVAAIATLRHPILQSDSVFTLGSIGVEKLMKIVLGTLHLRDTGDWPSKSVMRGWGHGVLEMNAALERSLEDNVKNATHQPYVRDLLDAHKQDQQWPLLVATLDRYGRSGRFYYLDHLAEGKPSDWEAPIEFWNRLERSITNDRPELLTVLANGNPEEVDMAYLAMSAASAKSLDNWWHLVHRFGIQKCFGERGATIGWEIWPSNRKLIE